MWNSAMKPARPGKPSEESPAMVKNAAWRGIFLARPPNCGHVAQVGLVVDGADVGEHEGRHHAVGEHLQHRAVDADLVHAGEAHQHVAHVADGRSSRPCT